MKAMENILLLLLILAFFVIGCRTAQTKKDESVKQSYTPQQVAPEDKFVRGTTTKAEVIAALGNPNGTAINEKGEEILTYDKSHITGKAFIPFYFGRDNYRRIIKKYTFNKNGILIETESFERHY